MDELLSPTEEVDSDGPPTAPTSPLPPLALPPPPAEPLAPTPGLPWPLALVDRLRFALDGFGDPAVLWFFMFATGFLNED